MRDTFTIIGPNVISGPWDDADYRKGHEFIADVIEALTGVSAWDQRDRGNWLINWNFIASK